MNLDNAPETATAYKAVLTHAFEAALAAGHPAQITADAMAELEQMPSAIIAIGKAAGAMAGAVRAVGCDAPGIMVTTDESFADIAGMACFASAHPVPDDRGIAAAVAVGDFADALDADDHLLLLISGGGSALVPAPPAPLTLADKQALNEALLASGLDIHAMNVVRRLFSTLKGGRLARRAYPARITAFLLSDVPDDRLESIASGPAAPDPVPFDDACRIVTEYGFDNLPFVQPYLDTLTDNPALQPVRPGDPVMAGVVSKILASNQRCQDAADIFLYDCLGGDNGVAMRFDLPALDGDVLDCARRLADAVCANGSVMSGGQNRIGFAVTGGETTVQLGAGPVGKGGRSQELALAFARAMHARSDAPNRWAMLAGGTDGRDGPTDAAGAIMVSSDHWDEEGAAGALATHNVHPFLEFQNALLRVNPTGTNLADLAIIIVERNT